MRPARIRPLTPNRGAADERNAILRYLRRQNKLTGHLELAIAWVQARRERYDRQPKGIGK